MSDISFNIQPVDEKPKRKNRVTRKNKYEPILDAFQGSEHSLVRVEGTGLDANYLRGQLTKVLDAKGGSSIEVSVRNKEVYLEKSSPSRS